VARQSARLRCEAQGRGEDDKDQLLTEQDLDRLAAPGHIGSVSVELTPFASFAPCVAYGCGEKPTSLLVRVEHREPSDPRGAPARYESYYYCARHTDEGWAFARQVGVTLAAAAKILQIDN
jgi:hypothetical protein